ncbi:PH domain-containing protein [Salinilacihabitans rarus]|uniref:PH domain-containing protein n=1 Tax=Salinilacihabitans rarus TaxID=2961596 RepID=UPI0020C90EF7|nr:PH domain-containing protein [Salinilacihabitans rarus]
MARGKPGLWSAVLGLPFVAAGAWLYYGQSQYPPTVGVPFALFGAFVVAIGAYVHTIGTPEELRLQEGERMIARRHPTQRVALVKVASGLPLLAATGYLLVFARAPPLYSAATLLVGLYLYSVGLYTYWTNTLTNYYVTNKRVVKEFRFRSLVRREVPLQKVRGVQERKSLVEALVGLGNVRVSGGDGSFVMQNVGRSGKFADTIRKLLASGFEGRT